MSGEFIKSGCTAAILLLAGCGSDYPDQAEISTAGEVDVSVFDQTRQAQVYYFDQEAINKSSELQQFKSALTGWIHAPDEQLPSVEFPDVASDVRMAIDEFQKQQASLSDAWKKNLAENTAALEVELATTQSELAQFEEKKAAFDEALAPANEKIAALETRIAETIERQSEMERAVVEGWNRYILENDLAVRTLDPERSRVFSYGWNTRVESCPSSSEAVTIDRLEEEGTCYTLWLPDETLLPAPINEQYADGFDEYRQLTEVRGRPYNVQGEADTLNRQLRDAQGERREDMIRAENRYGNHRQLERDLSSAQRRVDNIQRRIDRESNELARQNFERGRMRELRRDVQQELDRYVAIAANEIVKSVPSSGLSTSSPFPLEHQTDLLVFDLPISTFLATGNLLALKDMRQPGEEGVLNVALSDANTDMVSQRDLFIGIVERVALEAQQFE
ncbi:hypothetical protein [Vreelandella titanicae]|uniref:hypothetical protein n=1 Tax=Vreelandella titanicae TaxID=664683 RepID=UPI00381DCFFA